MKGRLDAAIVAGGRAVSLSCRLAAPPTRSYKWAWLGRIHAADRTRTSGDDSIAQQGSPFGENPLVLGDLWLPRPGAPIEVAIDVDASTGGRRACWRGLAVVEPGAGASVELAPCEPVGEAPAVGEASFAPSAEVPPDPAVVFRASTVTLTTPSGAAVTHPCFGTYGGFDPTRTRFWFARRYDRVAIVEVATGAIAGEIAVHGVVGPVRLHGDRLYTYRGGDYTDAEGKVFAESWLDAPARVAWCAPRWLTVPELDVAAARIAWTRRLGARTLRAWLDLETFAGGEEVT